MQLKEGSKVNLIDVDNGKEIKTQGTIERFDTTNYRRMQIRLADHRLRWIEEGKDRFETIE